MKTFFKILQGDAQQAIPMNNRLSLTRAFVETGDERCPLAGTWSRLPELDAALDDEPGLTRPARGVFLLGALPWRAVSLCVISHS
jgi:hypothetical protein